MQRIYKLSLTVLAVLTISLSVAAQNNFFTDAGENKTLPTTGQRLIIPEKFRTSAANVSGLKNFLWSLPSENAVLYNRNQAPVIELPMPDGKMAKFYVWESSIMQPGLAAKFPEMRTFAGQGIDDPYATIRVDYNPYFGFHAQILSAANGRIFIDPYARFDVNSYISYYTKDYSRHEDFICETIQNPNRTEVIAAGPCRGTQLFTYRLALACTGEYSVAVAGVNPTIPTVAAAMLTSVNRVTGVYEKEASIRMVLVANNNLLIYLDGASDPYTNNSGGAMLGQNQTNIDNIIGDGNYDIGHVFSTGGGGVAGLGVICRSGSKARGVTGLTNPVGDNYDIDYVAHEMGHQYAGNHTFNSSTGSCGGGNRNASTAYEVGSGTTIQAYAGICGTDDTQPHSDPFFHTLSFDEISNYAAGTGNPCAVKTNNGNTLPVITSMDNNGVTIPINTPFTLTGSATDANGDALTYCWEEWDLGPAGAWNSGATSTTAPLFKSRAPKTTGSRTFPDIAVILAGYPVNPTGAMGGLKGETLPTVARAMKFRLTVRDNRAGGGGVVTGGEGCQAGFTGTFQVNVAGTTPFAVTVPNGGESYDQGSTQTITWNNAGTDVAPFNVANVRVSMSIDGGLTYPIVLLASTPNDGSEAATIPLVITTTARIKIEALGNIFFDISNANFTVVLPPNSFDFNTPAPSVSACPAGATMTAALGTIQNGTFATPIILTSGTPPAGTTVSFSPNPVNPGSSTVVTLNNTNILAAGSYTITVTGTAGVVVRTRDITFTINPGANPAITAQPASQAICAGGNATFSITSASATLFKWQESTDGGATYTNISNAGVYSGTTTATLSITGATAFMNNNRYRCIASTQCGSTTSNAGILTVNTAPAITTQPADIILCAGSNNTFTVVATGSGLTYQWQSSPVGCAGPWTNIPTATAATYTLTGITAGQSNTGYRCVVTGTCIPVATSNCALLTVITSVAVTTQPSNISVCEGSNTGFTVAGSGTGIIYQWQVSTDGGSTFNNVTNGGIYSGATAPTLSITGGTFSLNNYRYRCQLSNATCTTPGVSNAAILTVNTLPAITAQPASVTICLGANTSFTSAATGTGTGYQWQVSTDGGTTFNNITNGGVYAGVTLPTLSITGATAVMNNYGYRCVVAGTCTPAAISNAATLTVISPVVVTTQPVPSVICSGSNTSFSVIGSSTLTIIYQWQVSTDGGTVYNNLSNNTPYSGVTTATLTITGASTALNNNRYRCQLSNATCIAPTASSGVLLTVRQLPAVTLTASPLTSLLPGQLTTITATPSASTGGTVVTNWLFNGNAPVPAIIGNSYVVNVEHIGTYQVLIQETFASPTLVCSNQSSIVTIDAAVSSKLFIFPSPNDGRFTVSYYNSSSASTKRKIAIFDSKGSLVYNREFSITGPYTLIPINLERANRGIYYVVVGDANGSKLADGKVHVR